MISKKAVYTALTAVILSASVFCSCSEYTDSSSKKNEISSTTKSIVKQTDNNKVSSVVNSIPELTVSKIDLGEGYIIFANSMGSYTLIDSDSREIASCYVTDDSGNKILIACSDNRVFIKQDDKDISNFIYGGHTIHLENNILYYDQSRVIYNDTSFSSYSLSEDCIIFMNSKGKYIIKNNKGKQLDKANIKDENGNQLVIAVENEIVTATNDDNELVDTFRINGDLILLTNGNVIVNGQKMVPPGSNDIVVSKATTTTVLSTVSSSAESTAEKITSENKTTTTVKQTEQTVLQYVDTETEPPQIDLPITDKPSVTTSTNSTNVTNQNISSETSEMLGYINEVRETYGLNPLCGLESLDKCSQKRSSELSQAYSHVRPNGSSFDTVTDENGLEWYHIAENIAYGYETVHDVFNAWMNSEGHRANILNPKMKYMAISKSIINNGESSTTYWEQIFFNDEYVP